MLTLSLSQRKELIYSVTIPSLSMRSRALFSTGVGLALCVSAACSATGATEPRSEDVRFEFTNTGPCKLIVNFSGGVATPTTGTDFIPAIGVRNDVPIYGAGSVSIQIGSAPAGDVSCNFRLGFSRGALYVLKDPFLPSGYCGGEMPIFTRPAQGRLTSYTGQIVRSEQDHC